MTTQQLTCTAVAATAVAADSTLQTTTSFSLCCLTELHHWLHRDLADATDDEDEVDDDGNDDNKI